MKCKCGKAADKIFIVEDIGRTTQWCKPCFLKECVKQTC